MFLFSLISTMSSLTLSSSPTPASCNIKELSKQLEIARKRQEAECAAQLRCQEEKERCKHEEKEQKERKEVARKEAEAKAWHDQEEAERCTHEEKGKDKVHGMSIGLDALLTSLYRRLLC